jgi:hypothetical protein
MHLSAAAALALAFFLYSLQGYPCFIVDGVLPPILHSHSISPRYIGMT